MVWTWLPGHLGTTAAGVRSAQEGLLAQVSLAQIEVSNNTSLPELHYESKILESVPKLLHGQTCVVTTFWVEFSSFPVFSTPTRLDFLEDIGTRTALTLPEDDFVLYWLVKLPLLSLFQCGHCIVWIQGALTFKIKENLSTCLSVKKEG